MYMKLCRVIVEGKVFLLNVFFFIMADIFDDVIMFLFFRKMLISANFMARMRIFLPYYKENIEYYHAAKFYL